MVFEYKMSSLSYYPASAAQQVNTASQEYKKYVD